MGELGVMEVRCITQGCTDDEQGTGTRTQVTSLQILCVFQYPRPPFSGAVQFTNPVPCHLVFIHLLKLLIGRDAATNG